MFNPYTNQYTNAMPPITPPSYQPTQKITEVNGVNGASAYPLAPNSSVLLLDNNLPMLYVKTTDGAGYPTIKAFDITEHKEDDTQFDFKSFENRLKKVEERLDEQSTPKKSLE